MQPCLIWVFSIFIFDILLLWCFWVERRIDILYRIRVLSDNSRIRFKGLIDIVISLIHGVFLDVEDWIKEALWLSIILWWVINYCVLDLEEIWTAFSLIFLQATLCVEIMVDSNEFSWLLINWERFHVIRLLLLGLTYVLVSLFFITFLTYQVINIRFDFILLYKHFSLSFLLIKYISFLYRSKIIGLGK